MRISIALILAAALDLLAFLAVWVWRSLTQHVSPLVNSLYFALGIMGFVLSVYGFIVLTKGGEKLVRRSGLLILFAFIPALAVLIALLKLVGGHPV